MKTKEIARRLMEIDNKMDQFVNQLQDIGVDIESSVLREISIPNLVAELFGITSEDDLEGVWCEYSHVDGSPESIERFISRLSEFSNSCPTCDGSGLISRPAPQVGEGFYPDIVEDCPGCGR